MVSHPKTPILNCFYYLLWLYCFLIQLLGPVIFCVGLTSMPHIPKQHHFTQKSAHEVLDAILEARVSPVFI